MACDGWREKLDAYLDGELASSDAASLGAHLRTCTSCSSETLERVLLKRSVAAAGKRYEASSELRAKIAKSIGAKPETSTERGTGSGSGWLWKILVIPALLVAVVSIAVNLYTTRESARRLRIYGELADLHVAALASTTPVDVVSTDKHTVKPWFEGKIPFTFNLPELQGTDFILVGGRVTYIAQTPGAQLIYRLRKHEISVFIFQDREGEMATRSSEPSHAFSFTLENWKQNGLHYFIVGDVGPEDIQALSKLFRDAS
jgi:anti-sigma factor RsiW